MKPAAYRRQKILDRLREQFFVSVSSLAKELNCSEMSIRRDMDRLAAQGLLEREHGGAVTASRVKLEFALADKAASHVAEKAAIGKAAAAMVQGGDRIILDTGTTMLAMARELRWRKEITVITTSLAIVAALLPASDIERILIGGTVRESAPELYGPLVEENLSRLHADWAFIGCDGLSVDGGLTSKDPLVIRSTEIIIANSKRVVLLCDASKAEQDSFISFAGIDDLDYLITDDRMPKDIIEAARERKVETVVVTPDRAEPAQ